jgi:hypothetical protein
MMISRNLSLRLKRLEARATPAGDPMVIEIQFVSPRRSMNTISVEIPQLANNYGPRGHAIRPRIPTDNVG